MENGYSPRDPIRALQPSQQIHEQTELRHLPAHHIKNLGDILEEDDQWKSIMSRIPGAKAGNKRFDSNDVELVPNLHQIL
jgi:hypothetical protein